MFVNLFSTPADLLLEAHRNGLLPFALCVEGDDGEDGGQGGGDDADPDKKDGEKPKPKLFTEEQVNSKLRGMAKELEKFKAREAERQQAEEEARRAEEEAKRKSLEKDGSLAELLALEREEKVKLAQRLQEAEARNQEFAEEKIARLEAQAEANAERLKRLPKEWRKAVPDTLDPDAARVQIERLEALIPTREVHGGGGRIAIPEDEDTKKRKKREALKTRGHDFVTRKAGER